MEDHISALNDNFGGSFDIIAVKNYKESLEKELIELENKLANNGNVSLRLKTVLTNVNEQKLLLEKLINDLETLQIDLDAHSSKVGTVQNVTADHIKKISLLERTNAYLNVVRHIESLSSAVESGLNERGSRAVSEYSQLCALAESMSLTSYSNLANYLHETVLYWHSLLKNRFTEDYDEVLRHLKWPFLAANIPPVPSSELLNRLHVLTETLIQIQLPAVWHEADKNGAGAGNLRLSLPIIYLIRPLKKRFSYHFSGSRQTNQADKPEWYFTQILTWLKGHQEFVEKHLQPVYDSAGLKTNARMEFARGLVQMAVEKLHWDLPHLQHDDALFSHTVDEALGFSTELREGYGYSSSEPGVISVLTQAHFFVKWVHLEKKYSLEKLDAIMRSETAFERCVIVEDGDHTTECVDKFLTLMLTITDRYCYLPQPGHRLQFLQLQLDLLDDFRVRLLQLLRAQETEEATSVSPAAIINSVSCLIYVLQEWNVSPHFLQLQYYRQQLENPEEKCNVDSGSDTGVFNDIIGLLVTMQEDLLDNLTAALVIDAKAQSRSYRRDRWHAMEESDDGVTASSVRMFNILTSGLCSLYQSLTPKLRVDALKRIARSLDSFFYEELVMQVFFSPSGAHRFHKDVHRGMLPLFGQYITKPEAQFSLLCDACTVLCLPQGSALLLTAALSDPLENEYMTADVLKDVKISSLSSVQVLQVLARRTDLS